MSDDTQDEAERYLKEALDAAIAHYQADPYWKAFYKQTRGQAAT